MYAIGANPIAARLVGIRAPRAVFIGFVLSGLCFALGGLILTSQLSAASPQAATGLELSVVTAIVLGGTSLTGGRGSALGTFLGLLIIGVLNNGLVLLNVSSFWQQVAQGCAADLRRLVRPPARPPDRDLNQPKGEQPMERFCFTFDVKPGQEVEYKRRHDEIWPELVEAIKAAGISNYGLFRRGRQVVAYCECEPTAAAAFERIGVADVNARWSRWFEDVLEPMADADGQLRTLTEVWHLDS